MRVRLIRKLANQLDGVDVSRHVAGDVIELTPREAGLLIAEGWAVAVSADTPVRRQVIQRRSTHSSPIHAEAADTTERRTIERLREVRREMEERRLDEQESRRAEDRIREELRDSRAKTVPR